MKIDQFRAETIGMSPQPVSGKKMKMMPFNIKIETLFQDVLHDKLQSGNTINTPASGVTMDAHDGTAKTENIELETADSEIPDEEPVDDEELSGAQGNLAAGIWPVIVTETDVEASLEITVPTVNRQGKTTAIAGTEAPLKETAPDTAVPATAAADPETTDTETLPDQEGTSRTDRTDIPADNRSNTGTKSKTETSPTAANAGGTQTATAAGQPETHTQTQTQEPISEAGDTSVQTAAPGGQTQNEAPAADQSVEDIPDETAPVESTEPVAEAENIEDGELAVEETDAPEEAPEDVPEEAPETEGEADPFEEMVSRASLKLAEMRGQRPEIRTPVAYTPRQEETNTSYVDNLRQVEQERAPESSHVISREQRFIRQETENPVAAVSTEPVTDRVAQTPIRQEAAAPRPVEMPSQAEQINTEVIRNLENKSMEFRMQLQPEELGRINIKMALEGGKLMIEIAASAKTAELLNRQIDNLVASVRYGTTELTSVQVVTETTQPGTAYLDNGMNNMTDRNAGQDQQNGRSGRGGDSGGQSGEMEEDEQKASDPSKLMDYAI